MFAPSLPFSKQISRIGHQNVPLRLCGWIAITITKDFVGSTALMLWLENGRTGEIRTRDQRIKSPLLYRLSYRPIFMALQDNDPRFYWIACFQKETFGNV